MEELNPPQPSLIREGNETQKCNIEAPPLIRGGREGFLYIPYDNRLVSYARYLRSNMTKAESKIWFVLLRDRKLKNIKFTRQKPIDKFIVDFYCPSLRLVVEIDGESHLYSLAKDTERTKILENKYCLKVVRYTNQEVLFNLDYVRDNLEKIIQGLFNPS